MKMTEDPCEYDKISKGNIAYHLWTLGNQQIIVRYRCHGYYKPYPDKDVCCLLIDFNTLSGITLFWITV